MTRILITILLLPVLMLQSSRDTYIKILIFTLSLLFALPSTKAHDPGQISYEYKQTGKLIIHFTPKGAIDLLRSLKTELENQSIINPSDYYPTFTDYFNQTINMKVEGQDLYLTFVQANLGQHDATIEFQLENYPGSYEGFNLKISSFTEIYAKVSNYVIVPLYSGKSQYILNRENISCTAFQASMETEGYQLEIKKSQEYLWGAIMSITILILSMLIYLVWVKLKRSPITQI